jgi:hypothetical protein
MTLHHDRDFVDLADEADARRAARRVSVIGSLVALFLGVGLVSLLIYGPMSEASLHELSANTPSAVPQIPTPTAPAP